jgi:hypothetical protein
MAHFQALAAKMGPTVEYMMSDIIRSLEFYKNMLDMQRKPRSLRERRRIKRRREIHRTSERRLRRRLQDRGPARLWMMAVKAYEAHVGESFPLNLTEEFNDSIRMKYQANWDGRRLWLTDRVQPKVNLQQLPHVWAKSGTPAP